MNKIKYLYKIEVAYAYTQSINNFKNMIES